MNVTAGRTMTTTIAMPTSHRQLAARNWSGGIFVTMVTMRPMNHGTALSDSATHSSTTNKAANSHFAWRAKCHRKAIRPDGGSESSDAAVGVKNCSKNANIFGWLQGVDRQRQSARQVERAWRARRPRTVATVLL